MRSIVLLAHSLDLSVTAEGVETSEQLTILKSQSCNQIQGYLVGRPAAVGDLALHRNAPDAERLRAPRSGTRLFDNAPTLAEAEDVAPHPKSDGFSLGALQLA